MLELGRRLRLFQEAEEVGSLDGLFVADDLHRDDAVEMLIEDAKDPAHATFADGFADVVFVGRQEGGRGGEAG